MYKALTALLSRLSTAILLLTIATTGCKSSNTAPAADEDGQDIGSVRFEFANPVTESEDEGIVTHELFLYEGAVKYNLGRVTGGVEILAADRFADYGIPAEALAAAGVHYGGDNYYYAIKENGSLKFYYGGPYVDENGDLKYEWQKGEPLLLGRWENKEYPEFWVYYSLDRFFSDGNEDGTLYEIKENSIVFDDVVNKIIKLTPTEFVEQNAEGTSTVWVKADL